MMEEPIILRQKMNLTFPKNMFVFIKEWVIKQIMPLFDSYLNLTHD